MLSLLTNPFRFPSGRFTEDGSFIGQYGTGPRKGKKQATPDTAFNAATFV